MKNGPIPARSRIEQTLWRGVPLAAIWLVLAGSGLEALIVGAALVPFATWLNLKLLPGRAQLRVGAFIALFPRFVWQSLLGAIDVAWRAFHPRLPIKPGRIQIPIHLSDGARVTLGGELSLMPGSVAAGCDGDRLLLHVLDLDRDIDAAVNEEARRVERALGGTKAGSCPT